MVRTHGKIEKGDAQDGDAEDHLGTRVLEVVWYLVRWVFGDLKMISGRGLLRKQ